VDCDKSVQIFTLYERAFSLVFSEEWLVGCPLLPGILGQLSLVEAKSHIKHTASKCFRLTIYADFVKFAVLMVVLVHTVLDYGNGVLFGLLLTWYATSGRYSSQQLVLSAAHITDAIISLHFCGSRTHTVQAGCSDIQGPTWKLAILPWYTPPCG